jgi:hypothetical protein
VFLIDGEPKRVITGKVTPDVFNYVYEDIEEGEDSGP